MIWIPLPHVTLDSNRGRAARADLKLGWLDREMNGFPSAAQEPSKEEWCAGLTSTSQLVDAGCYPTATLASLP